MVFTASEGYLSTIAVFRRVQTWLTDIFELEYFKDGYYGE